MLRMERQRYADKRSTRDGELKANVTFVEGKHSKQVHNNHHHRHHHHHNANNNTNDDDVMKSAVETSSRSFADDVSNDQLVIRHHRHHRHRHHHRHHLQNNNNNNDSNNVESNSHNNNNNNNNNDKRHHHHHHHRHRRHRHHNEQSIKAYNHDVDDDDDVADVVVGDDDDKHKKDHPHVKGKMMATDLEDISSELDEVIKQQQQQQQYQPHDYAHLTRAQVVARRHARLPRGHMDSPSVISVSSSHSSLSNKNYSHSPAVVVDNESPHGHKNQPGSVLAVKHKRNKSKNAKRSTSPTLMLMSTAMAKRSRTESRSPSQEPSDSDSSKSESSHSSQLSSGSNSDSDGSIRTHSSSSSSSSSGSGSGTGSQGSDSNASTHSAALKGELFKDAVVKVIDNNNGLDIENHVSSKETTPLNEETINGGHGETVVKCTLPNYYPGVQGCRSVEEFQCLNRIEEGTYGVVYRAKDKKTDELVALKRLKMEKETEGFPITSLREINTLLKGQHPNIVTVREIVVGSNMDQIFIVMDYVEHDLKSLMQTMKTRKQSFLPSEVKCLTQQLLCAVAHLHDNWILHRDLKTSNLLLSHKGILKVADFGLAREYGSPLKRYTPVVVTLWYRAPELLLCSPEYSTPVDMWSVGCIFAEMIRMHPLFPGQTEMDQLSRIYKELGTPNEKIWPGYKELPAVKNVMSQNSQFTDFPICNLKKRFANNTTDIGIDLLQGMLTYDPSKRLTAEKALQHEYFKELPLPIDPSMFPTWPAKSELGERKAAASSPKPPPGGTQFKKQLEPGLDGDYTKGAGFQLKF